MQASFEELINVDEIGNVIAKSVIEFFNDLANIQIIDRLKAKGLQFELSKKDIQNQTDKLKGKTFVVSGVFTQFSRNEFKKINRR